MTRLALRTQGSAYTASKGAAVVETQLDGGAPRSRRDVLNPAWRVTATWQLNRTDYNYFWAFHETTLVEGSLPFTVDLIVDAYAKAIYTAKFVANSVRTTAIAGGVYTVTGELWVTPPARNAVTDAATVSAYNTAHGV